jgi:hypothetical protein
MKRAWKELSAPEKRLYRDTVIRKYDLEILLSIDEESMTQAEHDELKTHLNWLDRWDETNVRPTLDEILDENGL